MKELNQLLKYIDSYNYDYKEEKIVFIYTEEVEEAKNIYTSLRKKFTTPSNSSLYNTEDLEWHFDIAIDCIKNMNEEDKTYIVNHPFPIDYHFGYGTYIRNNYIYSSKKHDYFMADNESSNVLDIIVSILHPRFDFTNEAYVNFVTSYHYHDLFKIYYTEYSNIFINIEEEMLSSDSPSSTDNAICLLQTKLKQEVGRDNFIQIVNKYYDEFTLEKKFYRDNVEDFLKKLEYKCPLFKLEYNQFSALLRLGLLFDMNIDSYHLDSLTSIQKYIDDKLGLKKSDTKFMAKCFSKLFEIHHKKY